MDDEIQHEAERLWAEHLKSRGGFVDLAGRFAGHALRIGSGFAIATVLYGYRGRLTAITHKPIAQLSIADLGSLIGYIVLGLAGVAFVWWVAIGPSEGPKSATDFHEQARKEVKQRGKVAKAYARSRLWGILTDPKVSARWGWMIIVGLYGVIALIASRNGGLR